MQLNIKSNRMDVTPQLEQEIRERVKRAFLRTGDRIARVVVSFRDINGPKGGVDTLCKIKLSVHGLPSILTVSQQQSIPHSFAASLNKASETLKRKLKRENRVNRRTLVPPYLQTT